MAVTQVTVQRGVRLCLVQHPAKALGGVSMIFSVVPKIPTAVPSILMQNQGNLSNTPMWFAFGDTDKKKSGNLQEKESLERKCEATLKDVAVLYRSSTCTYSVCQSENKATRSLCDAADAIAAKYFQFEILAKTIKDEERKKVANQQASQIQPRKLLGYLTKRCHAPGGGYGKGSDAWNGAAVLVGAKVNNEPAILIAAKAGTPTIHELHAAARIVESVLQFCA